MRAMNSLDSGGESTASQSSWLISSGFLFVVTLLTFGCFAKANDPYFARSWGVNHDMKIHADKANSLYAQFANFPVVDFLDGAIPIEPVGGIEGDSMFDQVGPRLGFIPFVYL
jgi:hypothetical protein